MPKDDPEKFDVFVEKHPVGTAVTGRVVAVHAFEPFGHSGQSPISALRKLGSCP